MNSVYKYLIFFLIGIILSLYLKKDLVEGYLDISNIHFPFTTDYEGYLTSGEFDNLVISKASNIKRII